MARRSPVVAATAVPRISKSKIAENINHKPPSTQPTICLSLTALRLSTHSRPLRSESQPADSEAFDIDAKLLARIKQGVEEILRGRTFAQHQVAARRRIGTRRAAGTTSEIAADYFSGARKKPRRQCDTIG